MKPDEIITYPLMTESASVMVERDNNNLRRVNLKAGKQDIKRAVEIMYEVKVDNVNVLITHKA